VISPCTGEILTHPRAFQQQGGIARAFDLWNTAKVWMSLRFVLL